MIRRASPRSPASRAEDIVQLAREYADTRPAVIRLNYGVQRSERGGAAVRAISTLPALTGSWKEVGGGLQLSTSQAFQFNTRALEMPELQERSALGREARIVNMAELGKALTELDAPPVKAMVVYNSNPASIAPNQAKVLAGMRRDDLFTVVLEQFQTDTADYADILLPATTFLEHTDLYRSYGHYYVQLARPALEAPGEARSNVEVFRDLALRMGFDDQCFRDSEDIMIRSLLRSGHPFLDGITLERLDREHSIRLNVSEPGNPIPAVRGRRVWHSVRQVRVRRRSAGLRSAGRIALRRRVPARPLSAGADLVEERRQHELDLRQPSGCRCGYRAAPPEQSRRRWLAASRPATACACSTIAAACCCAPMSMAWCSPASPALPPCAGISAPRTPSMSTCSPPSASPTWAADRRSTVAWCRSSAAATKRDVNRSRERRRALQHRIQILPRIVAPARHHGSDLLRVLNVR